jgi:hypothetical protein
MSMPFSVDFYDRGAAGAQLPVRAPAGCTVIPQRWSWSVTGGPDEAEITVTGPIGSLYGLFDWLRYGVDIVPETGGVPVWTGYIAEVAVNLGTVEIGLSLDGMYNRVAVAYTYRDADNIDQRSTTAWVEDTFSSGRYGARELLYSRSSLDETQADALAALLLEKYKAPVPFVREGGASTVEARLSCAGWWSTLGWRYYKREDGREVNNTGSGADQQLGVGVTSANIVLMAADGKIWNVGGQHGFEAGNKVKISGATNSGNNAVKTISSNGKHDTLVYTASTISFATVDDMRDSANGFDGFKRSDPIVITGSAANSGPHTIKSIEEEGVGGGTDYDHIEIDPAVVSAESAGTSVTLRRMGYIVVEEPLVTEGPSATVTITAYGKYMAQKFTTLYDADWPLREVKIKLRKIGSPTDNVQVTIQADSSGSPSGTNLMGSVATVAGADVSADYAWTSFTWSAGNSYTIEHGTDYWIAISRSGSDDPDNYFEIAVSEALGYSRGNLKVYDGSAWQTRPTDADMLFEVWGREDNGTQLATLVDTVGQFFDQVILRQTAGIDSYQYRDGDDLALDEANRLLEQGTDNDRRFVADVIPARTVIIEEQAYIAAHALSYTIDGDGIVRDGRGMPVPPGRSIAGQWLTVTAVGLPDFLANPFEFYVESCEWDNRSGQLSYRPANAPDPYDVAKIQQG